MDAIQILAIAGIIALASFVRSAIGFGMGLIAIPLLDLVKMEMRLKRGQSFIFEWPNPAV